MVVGVAGDADDEGVGDFAVEEEEDDGVCLAGVSYADFVDVAFDGAEGEDDADDFGDVEVGDAAGWVDADGGVFLKCVSCAIDLSHASEEYCVMSNLVFASSHEADFNHAPHLDATKCLPFM